MIMKTFKWQYILFLTPFLFYACAKEQQPTAWLKIDKWILNENPNAHFPQGEMTQDFDQIFVSMDGKSLGSYQLPAKIPLVANTGKHDFVFMAGIKENGINSTKKRYPFVRNYEHSIYVIENDTISITPETSYFSNIRFLIENFESPTLKLEEGSISLAHLIRDNDPQFLQWGNYYGSIHLTKQDSVISFVTTFNESFPKQATPIYLELDYFNTNSMLTTLISYGNGSYYSDPYVQINAQKSDDAVWKHMYINFMENVSYRVNSPKNEIEFTLVLDPDLISSDFYIDNIKIVYPE